MIDEIIPIPEVEPEFKTTLTPEQLEAALAEVRGRSYSARHPELGKMRKCQVCGLRHRDANALGRVCAQKFTYHVKDKEGRLYAQYREVEKDGETEVIPDYRTAVPAGDKPTVKQVVGAAQFAKKRFHPHYSKIKLQFIERVRVIFAKINTRFQANLLRVEPESLREDIQKAYVGMFKELLQRSRVVAARQLRKERRAQAWETRTRQHESRRINRGLV